MSEKRNQCEKAETGGRNGEAETGKAETGDRLSTPWARNGETGGNGGQAVDALGAE